MPSLPQGFRATGLYCGIKRDATKLDLSLIVTDVPATAAGTYTQNLVFAAPVKLDRSRTPNEHTRVIAINSGNANACTGERGDRDCATTAAMAAELVGVKPEQALVLSTGIIGEFLPMEKIAAGLKAAHAKLGTDEASLVAAARGMLTTDTRHKLAGETLVLGGRKVTIGGMAKGAAMIGPNMATMLGVILTDAALSASAAQTALLAAVADSFNCISVEGHMSTNDTVLLLANGAAGGARLAGDDLAQFQAALNRTCVTLAKAIPEDGEGVSHVVTIDVSGCQDRAAARLIAQTVANSSLVKTAIAGADPNWGRIVSAAGYAGVPFKPEGVTLHVNGFKLYERGAPVAFDAAAVSKSIAANRETSVQLQFAEGNEKVRFWTTDLTAEYVKLNADYHT